MKSTENKDMNGGPCRGGEKSRAVLNAVCYGLRFTEINIKTSNYWRALQLRFLLVKKLDTHRQAFSIGYAEISLRNLSVCIHTGSLTTQQTIFVQ